MRIVSSRVLLTSLAAVFAAAAPPVLAQGGLPPDPGRTIREGMSRPRMTRVQAQLKEGAGPGGCLMRDASFAIFGGNFGPTADGRRLIASRRGTLVGPVTVLAWAPARIDARLSLGADLEGETIAVDLVNARGESLTLAGGVSFPVCFRDQTFLGGNLRLPTCASEHRRFRVVAEGPGHLERVVNVSPHAASAAYGFSALAQGSWVVSASEIALHPTPTPRPGAGPFGGPIPIGGPSGGVPVLAGCSGPSLGFDPRSRTVVISNAQHRATGVDFAERLLSLPSPALPGAFGATPTPGGPGGSVPYPRFSFPTLTPTPVR
ncbi:MAG: hypothetical protein NEA02_04305 [Thermoanaerobaculia bacterium]|nr:hypothetical protein [Thermoanaerobaculia bacterium]